MSSLLRAEDVPCARRVQTWRCDYPRSDTPIGRAERPSQGISDSVGRVTFVVSLTGLPNGGYVANDLRVGAYDTRGHFCPWIDFGLQKVYPIGPYVVAGFAGSVELGFWAIHDLRRYVGDPPEGVAVYPSVIARWWWRRPRRAWGRVPERLRKLGLSVILVGASPDPTPLNVSHGFVFRSPNFEFERIAPMRPTGIGSGNGVPTVTAALDDLVDPENLNEGLFRFEVGFPMGGAGALGFALGAALTDEPTDHVSAEFQTWRVARGRVEMSTNEMTALTPGAASRVFPPLATSWPEFQQLASEAGQSAAAAVA